MKLRYYLRGLGIGIVVTAVILALTKGEGESLTDAQIKERAAQLGMVESGSLLLSDLQEPNAEPSEPSGGLEEPESEPSGGSEEPESVPSGGSEEPESEPSDGSEESETELTDEGEKTEPDAADTPEGSETESADGGEESGTESTEPEEDLTTVPGNQGMEEGDLVTVTILSGASSYSVSKDLAEAGLIADAAAFDTYLCANGYAKSIRTGTYGITVGTSEEEIAKIITGKR